MNNKGILTLIAVVLIAILGVVTYEATKKTPEEKIADSVADTVDDIGETITGKE